MAPPHPTQTRADVARETPVDFGIHDLPARNENIQYWAMPVMDELAAQQHEDSDKLTSAEKLARFAVRYSDDYVVSGISGRFPESDSVQHFGENLLNKVDLITCDDRRYPHDYNEVPRRFGKLTCDLSKFDATYFQTTPKLAHLIDPALRKMLELVHEAIRDAGFDPSELRGQRIGVFAGVSFSESAFFNSQRMSRNAGNELLGTNMAMFANRISFAFDFRGPSFPIDTACSSSTIAVQVALESLRNGTCTAAIVTGQDLSLLPYNAISFHQIGLTSPDGISRPFDEKADGYVRGEALVAILIQRSRDCRRSYCTLVHAKSSADGYKASGILMPNGDRHAELMQDVLNEAGVEASQVSFVEAHATGTAVGDPQELNGIAKVFGADRTPENPLLIGSVKSNMGHSEPCAGLCSLAKVIVAFETGLIPPNINYDSANVYAPALIEEKLKVVTEPTPFPGGYVALNSFGFGGANAHVLLKPNPRREPTSYTFPLDVPKVLCAAGRTAEACKQILEAAVEHKENHSMFSLLWEQAHLNMDNFPYRGHALYYVGEENKDKEPVYEIKKVPSLSESAEQQRPIWFIYAGMGSQWTGMAQQLLRLPVFRFGILRCTEALKRYGTGIDLMHLLTKENTEETWADTRNAMCAVIAIQIALTDVLLQCGIEPDGIVGHSTGEMACGYADNTFTREQTLMVAYHRANTIVEHGLNKSGAMAAVGLSFEQATNECPEGVEVVCDNAEDSVTVSGDKTAVENFVKHLEQRDVFAKMVGSTGVAFHSKQLKKIRTQVLTKTEQVIPHPRPRSKRWISTSVELEEDTKKEEEEEEGTKDEKENSRKSVPDWSQLNSAEYHVNNMLSPVRFRQALARLPQSAVAIEIAPHSLLQALFRRNLPASVGKVGLVNARAKCGELESLLNGMAAMHYNGVRIKCAELYPQVLYPVPAGTPMIAHHIGWEHKDSYNVVKLDSRETPKSVYGVWTLDAHSNDYDVCR